MIRKAFATLKWLPYYYGREIKRRVDNEFRAAPRHIYFCICDHFEPYRGKADKKTARRRIRRWTEGYPQIAQRYLDSEGHCLKYSFFYPEEEYQQDDLAELAELCHAGFGEVEIHLHHDNDTSENLRRTLLDFKRRLHEKHGLLSVNRETGEIVYGFIHGNWALDNSSPDCRWCGVNDELSVLMETGCYADFTMPSAPDLSQTRKVNSIYYALDDPRKPKSHDWGVEVEAGKKGEGLLMVQGPLTLDWSRRKYGVLPSIENSGLYGNTPPTRERVRLWLETGISLKREPEHVFVKLYTHGAHDTDTKMLLDDGGLATLFDELQRFCELNGSSLHFLSARETANAIRHLERGDGASRDLMRDDSYVMAGARRG